MDRKWIKSLIFMVIAVFFMGVGVSLLNWVGWGADPCSAMNYGVSSVIGWSFGNYQLCFNIVFLILVIILQITLKKQLLGLGTICNMVGCGYIADFTTWMIHNVWGAPLELTIGVKIAIFIPALIVFVIAAAVYMQSGQGMAPYDAFPFLVNVGLTKKFPKHDYFSIIRYALDAAALIIAIVTHGSWGVATVCMLVLLSPAVTLAGKVMKKVLA